MLDGAYQWLCRQRTHYPHNVDVWDLRLLWGTLTRELIGQLRSGRYRFRPQQRITLADGEPIHPWSAGDVLMLKAMATVLGLRSGISPRCTHVKEHGGAWARGAGKVSGAATCCREMCRQRLICPNSLGHSGAAGCPHWRHTLRRTMCAH